MGASESEAQTVCTPVCECDNQAALPNAMSVLHSQECVQGFGLGQATQRVHTVRETRIGGCAQFWLK